MTISIQASDQRERPEGNRAAARIGSGPCRALIVEDDDRIIGSIEDVLFSIGHEHDWATNQLEAQHLLREHDYDYVLLDLQIPAKPNRGGADKEFGCNLLRDIQRIKGSRRTPVVVMIAYSSDCLDLSTELHAEGASDFISKPFSNNGRTLASVIRKVLGVHGARMPVSARKNGKTSPFAGGVMTFHDDRVELEGVTIITDRGAGQSMAILNELRRKDAQGRFIRCSGEHLAETIGALGGVGTITGCIQTLRQNATTRLKKTGIAVGREDVIAHDEQGYFLRDGITIAEEVAPTVPVPDETSQSDLNQRQLWILDQLQRGVELRRPMVEKHFDIGQKTAKRDLADLVQRGLIQYVRHGRTGYYELLAAD